MKALHQTYLIDSPIEKVWQALVDPKVINRWGGGPAKMTGLVDQDFSLWGGDVHGTNKKVVAREKLVQDWYGGEWEEPSFVTFNLKEKDGQTEIELLQKNVPDQEADDISDGWQRYYLGEIKKYLEAS